MTPRYDRGAGRIRTSPAFVESPKDAKLCDAVAIARGSGSNGPTMLPDALVPTIDGPNGPPSSRVYMRDLDLEIETRVCEIADDGDPHFPPVISVSPDHRRFALVTRRVKDNATHVHLAEHDNRQWHATPLSDLPGTDTRI